MILVTGASGRLASMVIAHLTRFGASVAGGTRSPLAGDRVMDFDDPDTLDMSQVDTLVLVSAGYAEDDIVIARHAAAIDAARRWNVGHAVYTSLIGDGDHLGFVLAHRATERLLKASGLSWTILRNGLYAELIGALLIWDEAGLWSPLGSGVVAAPTRDDLAVAAARVALDPGPHSGQVYELTGRGFTAADVGEALGVGVRQMPLGAYRQQLLSDPALLPFQPPMLLSIASSIRHGFLDKDRSDLAPLLDRAPRSGLDAAVAAAAASRPA